jgi:hypothetical protein
VLGPGVFQGPAEVPALLLTRCHSLSRLQLPSRLQDPAQSRFTEGSSMGHTYQYIYDALPFDIMQWREPVPPGARWEVISWQVEAAAAEWHDGIYSLLRQCGMTLWQDMLTSIAEQRRACWHAAMPYWGWKQAMHPPFQAAKRHRQNPSMLFIH